ncbi:hypothetical protein QYM36_010008, partial [Artemia franciscana]
MTKSNMFSLVLSTTILCTVFGATLRREQRVVVNDDYQFDWSISEDILMITVTVIQEKEELNSHSSARSESKPAIKAETIKEKEIPIKVAPDEVEKEPFCHSRMKSTVESIDEELKIKEVEEKPLKTNEMEEIHISQSGIITQALKKGEDDIKRRPDLCGTTESSQIEKDEEEIEENVSENSNTFDPSNPSKEKVKPL